MFKSSQEILSPSGFASGCMAYRLCLSVEDTMDFQPRAWAPGSSGRPSDEIGRGLSTREPASLRQAFCHPAVRLSGIVARIAPAVHRRVFATAQRRDGHAHIPGEHGIVQKQLGLAQERLQLGLEDELPLSVQGVWERRRDGSQPLGICFEARFGLPLLALGGWDEATELLS